MKKLSILLLLALFLGLNSYASTSGSDSDYEPSSSSQTTRKSSKKSSKSTKKTTTSPSKTNTPTKKDSSESAGPDWLNGTWEYKGVISTVMGAIKVDAKLFINTRTRQLVAVCNGSTDSKGTYYVSDNTIYAPSQMYFKLDMTNQRIDYGNGNYYRKISNTSYLGN